MLSSLLPSIPQLINSDLSPHRSLYSNRKLSSQSHGRLAPSLGPAYTSRAGRGYSRPGPVVGALQLVVLLTIVTIILVKIW